MVVVDDGERKRKRKKNLREGEEEKVQKCHDVPDAMDAIPAADLSLGTPTCPYTSPHNGSYRYLTHPPPYLYTRCTHSFHTIPYHTIPHRPGVTLLPIFTSSHTTLLHTLLLIETRPDTRTRTSRNENRQHEQLPRW